MRPVIFLMIVPFILLACSKEQNNKNNPTIPFSLSSPAFKSGGFIPVKYTCDGANISPTLQWTNLPVKCKSLALICDDPDAPGGTWVHWVIFNISAKTNLLPENMPSDKILADNSKQGVTDFQTTGYGGPCPPSGTHRYYFKLYALDTVLDIEAGSTKQQLLQAMAGHILSKALLMGKYERQK